MSGGALDYVDSRIEYAAGQIRDWIRERTGGPHPKREHNPLHSYDHEDEQWEYDWTPHPYYVKHHPDVPYIQTAEALKAKTLEYLEQTVQYMLLAAKLAHEAEWMMSDDTGPETFCMECEKLLAKHKAGGWPEESDGEEEP